MSLVQHMHDVLLMQIGHPSV